MKSTFKCRKAGFVGKAKISYLTNKYCGERQRNVGLRVLSLVTIKSKLPTLIQLSAGKFKVEMMRESQIIVVEIS